jgi:hypothetical protein
MNSDRDAKRGDEGKVTRSEERMSDWIRDVVREEKHLGELTKESKKEMTKNMLKLERNFEGYWCEGLTCECQRSHWVLNASESNCWECMHDPCACVPPLVWDETEQAYYRFGIKTNIWMSEPRTCLAKYHYHRKEKERKENEERVREHEDCARKQEKAQEKGFCCHHHQRKYMLEKEEETRKRMKVDKVDSPYHCIHCDEDPCVFVQIESRLCANDEIYHNEEDFAKAPAAYNSSRRKRAFRYAASILFEGINYRKKHFTCVENGVRALFPPLDGKIMGYKNK